MRFFVVIAVLAIGCHATTKPQTPASPTSESRAAEPPSTDTLALLFFRLERLLTPVRDWRIEAERSLRADSAAPRADSTFMRARSSLRDVIGQLEPEFDKLGLQDLAHISGADWSNEARYDRARARVDSITAFLALRGVSTSASEGDLYFAPSELALLQWLGRFLPASTIELLRMSAREQQLPTANDAAIMISNDELEVRLLAAEQYARQYPRSAGRPEVMRTYRQLLAIYLTGIDNSPIFDARTRRLNPDMRKRFELYAEEHAATESGRIVADYLQLLMKNRFLRNAAVEAFQRKLWDAVPD